jgi:membrane associated rhomboid family serine protease
VEKPGRLRVATALTGLLLTAGVVMTILFWPEPVDTGWSSSIERVLRAGYARGLPRWFGYNELEFSANIIMFMPLGFFASLLFPARWALLAVPVLAAFSFAAETIQESVLADRVSDPRDIVANTTGALLGALVGVVLTALVHLRDRQREAASRRVRR